jgi:hypothetical protein
LVSSQDVPFGEAVFEQPEIALQASTVQGFESLHESAVPPAQTPT